MPRRKKTGYKKDGLEKHDKFWRKLEGELSSNHSVVPCAIGEDGYVWGGAFANAVSGLRYDGSVHNPPQTATNTAVGMGIGLGGIRGPDGNIAVRVSANLRHIYDWDALPSTRISSDALGDNGLILPASNSERVAEEQNNITQQNSGPVSSEAPVSSNDSGVEGWDELTVDGIAQADVLEEGSFLEGISLLVQDGTYTDNDSRHPAEGNVEGQVVDGAPVDPIRNIQSSLDTGEAPVDLDDDPMGVEEGDVGGDDREMILPSMDPLSANEIELVEAMITGAASDFFLKDKWPC